jgi:outer membrane protein assembly factor BamB
MMGPSDVWSSPAVAGDRVYLCGTNGIYCLDAANGSLMWKHPTNGFQEISSPSVADGKVYAGSEDGKVYCLDAMTGTLAWTYATGDSIPAAPAVTDGIVFVGSVDNKTYALNASTGALIWSYTTDGMVESSPAIAEGMVYVGSFDDKVYCLDAATGEHVWSYKTENDIFSSPAIADGKVFVGSYDHRVYCLNAVDGSLIWSYATGDWVGSSPAVADGTVYVGSGDGKVYAFGPPRHDIAVTTVSPFKTTVGQGYTINANVTVSNVGDYTETFNVTIYANDTALETKEAIALPSGNVTQLTFTWNASGFAYGNYSITAHASPVANEPYTTNNKRTDGWVTVTIPGDLNVDEKVDIYDAILLVGCFSPDRYVPHWNPNRDINNDGTIDIYDAMILANNYGKTST